MTEQKYTKGGQKERDALETSIIGLYYRMDTYISLAVTAIRARTMSKG